MSGWASTVCRYHVSDAWEFRLMLRRRRYNGKEVVGSIWPAQGEARWLEKCNISHRCSACVHFHISKLNNKPYFPPIESKSK